MGTILTKMLLLSLVISSWNRRIQAEATPETAATVDPYLSRGLHGLPLWDAPWWDLTY